MPPNDNGTPNPSAIKRLMQVLGHFQNIELNTTGNRPPELTKNPTKEQIKDVSKILEKGIKNKDINENGQVLTPNGLQKIGEIREILENSPTTRNLPPSKTASTINNTKGFSRG